MHRLRNVVLALALIGGAVAASSGDTVTYTAPYPLGPAGGDAFNLVDAGEDGRIVAGRLSPMPGAISCEVQGGYATYEITHAATAPLTSIALEYAEAAIDPYVFVTILVIDDDGRFLGNLKQRGILTGDGVFEVPVHWPDEEEFRPRDVRIQFGLELTTACPSADAGTLRFASVAVTS